MPLSWLLLEQFHWGLVPQVQPMRALLFVTAFVLVCAAELAALLVRLRSPELLAPPDSKGSGRHAPELVHPTEGA